MKERLDELTALLAEEEKMSKLNFVLSLLVALLSGVIIGFLFAPKRSKTSYMGCYNGNNNSNNNDCCDCDDCDCEECDDCEGGLCCEDCDEERCCGEHEFCGNDTQCCDDDFEMEEEDDKQDGEMKEYVKIM